MIPAPPSTPSTPSTQATQALALLLALAASGCDLSAKAEERGRLNQELRRREATKVLVTPVEQREMVRALSTTTNVESEREIDIYPRITGVVTELRAEEGDRVEAEQVLCILDQREARAALADAEVAAEEAENAVSRLELSVQEALERAEGAKLGYEQAVREVQRNEQAGLLSTVDIDRLRLTRDTNMRDWSAAKLSHEIAKQQLAAQETAIRRAGLTVEREELNLSYTEVTAPFAGVVAARSVKVGDTATGSAPAYTLTDTEHLRAVVYRPQAELSFFQAAGRVESDGSRTEEVEIRVYPDALPGEEFRGTIRFLSPTIDAGSGSFRVTIDLEQAPTGSERPRLLPGMLIRLEIVTERHPDALVVPKRALRREGDAHHLFTVRDGHAVRIAVNEGFSDDENVEVAPLQEGALSAQDLVVVVGNRDLEDGAQVEVESWIDDADPAGPGGPESAELATASQQDAGASAGESSTSDGAD